MGIGFQRSWFGLHLSCVKDPVIFPESERARERESERQGGAGWRQSEVCS